MFCFFLVVGDYGAGTDLVRWVEKRLRLVRWPWPARVRSPGVWSGWSGSGRAAALSRNDSLHSTLPSAALPSSQRQRMRWKGTAQPRPDVPTANQQHPHTTGRPTHTLPLLLHSTYWTTAATWCSTCSTFTQHAAAGGLPVSTCHSEPFVAKGPGKAGVQCDSGEWRQIGCRAEDSLAGRWWGPHMTETTTIKQDQAGTTQGCAERRVSPIHRSVEQRQTTSSTIPFRAGKLPGTDRNVAFLLVSLGPKVVSYVCIVRSSQDGSGI
jgi:hypothetical protein